MLCAGWLLLVRSFGAYRAASFRNPSLLCKGSREFPRKMFKLSAISYNFCSTSTPHCISLFMFVWIVFNFELQHSRIFSSILVQNHFSHRYRTGTLVVVLCFVQLPLRPKKQYGWLRYTVARSHGRLAPYGSSHFMVAIQRFAEAICERNCSV